MRSRDEIPLKLDRRNRPGRSIALDHRAPRESPAGIPRRHQHHPDRRERGTVTILRDQADQPVGRVINAEALACL
jgi:hypothetical protein